MALSPITSDSGLALTFDDVLLVPAASEIMPSQVDVAPGSPATIPLNIPIISSAMDTVTEAPLAIAMAQEGGIGVIHRNLAPEEQARQVRDGEELRVRAWSSNPVTIHPDATLADALALMADHSISGIPVVERGGGTRPAGRHPHQPRRALRHQPRQPVPS